MRLSVPCACGSVRRHRWEFQFLDKAVPRTQGSCLRKLYGHIARDAFLVRFSRGVKYDISSCNPPSLSENPSVWRQTSVPGRLEETALCYTWPCLLDAFNLATRPTIRPHTEYRIHPPRRLQTISEPTFGVVKSSRILYAADDPASTSRSSIMSVAFLREGSAFSGCGCPYTYLCSVAAK